MQSLAEQRAGGETGVAAVQCLAGDAVWKAQDDKRFDPQLFAAAWEKLATAREDRPLRELVPEPKLMIVEYRDGLRVFLLELNGAVSEWAAAWRYTDDSRIEATQFRTQEARPAYHFELLLRGIERMIAAASPPGMSSGPCS